MQVATFEKLHVPHTGTTVNWFVAHSSPPLVVQNGVTEDSVEDPKRNQKYVDTFLI